MWGKRRIKWVWAQELICDAFSQVYWSGFTSLSYREQIPCITSLMITLGLLQRYKKGIELHPFTARDHQSISVAELTLKCGVSFKIHHEGGLCECQGGSSCFVAVPASSVLRQCSHNTKENYRRIRVWTAHSKMKVSCIKKELYSFSVHSFCFNSCLHNAVLTYTTRRQ